MLRRMFLAGIILTAISAGPAEAAPDLIRPLPDVAVGSPYGDRQHPITKTWRRHNGVDLPAHHGAPVAATGAGQVTMLGWVSGYGRQIWIDHGDGWETRYAHLSKWAEGLHVNQIVAQGEVVGYVGSSGGATGAHLHYEIKVNGKFIDPETTF